MRIRASLIHRRTLKRCWTMRRIRIEKKACFMLGLPMHVFLAMGVRPAYPRIPPVCPPDWSHLCRLRATAEKKEPM